MMEQLTWTNARRALGDLTAWEHNPRQVTAQQAERLAESLRQFGQIQTIAIEPDGTLIDGHQRQAVWAAAQEYGPSYEVDVRVASRKLTSAEREKVVVYLHAGATGQWDWEKLAAWDMPTLASWGFDDHLLRQWNDDAANLREMLEAEAETVVPDDPGAEIDRAEELREKWGVAAGDVWRAGEHFVICGDCREPETWARLLQAAGVKKVNGVFTSPPYWVGKNYEQQFTWDEVQKFIADCSKVFTEFVMPQGRIVINTGTCQAGKLRGGIAQMRLLLDDWQRELEENGWFMRYVRFWVKRGGLPLISPDMDVIDVHSEFLGYFYNPKNKPFVGQRRVGGDGKKWAIDGIWDDIPGTRSANGHEAAFPVELVTRNLLLYSDAGDVWLDPFLGSGTTIVAAHGEGRRGLGIERLEKYVAVTLERLAGLGLEPVRLG